MTPDEAAFIATCTPPLGEVRVIGRGIRTHDDVDRVAAEAYEVVEE
jgi:hypothetical protein